MKNEKDWASHLSLECASKTMSPSTQNTEHTKHDPHNAHDQAHRPYRTEGAQRAHQPLSTTVKSGHQIGQTGP